jgi:hypothetical protein
LSKWIAMQACATWGNEGGGVKNRFDETFLSRERHYSLGSDLIAGGTTSRFHLAIESLTTTQDPARAVGRCTA